MSKKAATATTDATSGGTFTASDLYGSWTSGCVANVGPMAGMTYSKYSMTLFSSSSFNYSQTTYNNGGCTPPALGQFSSGGTYTVGGVTSGSLQAIDWTVTYSGIAVYTAGLVTAINGGGGCVGGGWVLNTSRSTYTTTCGFVATPNSSNQTVANVGSLSGNTLSMGAVSDGIPGAFGTTPPASASVTFTR